MIINVGNTQREIDSEKFGFSDWQQGLFFKLLDRLSVNSKNIITINMGYGAGHTFFARAAATKLFPIRTKVYVMDSSEFADLVFHPEDCHEPIDVFGPQTIPNSLMSSTTQLISNLFVPSPMRAVPDLVVIDCASQPISIHKDCLDELAYFVLPRSDILILEPTI